jgi:RND family efflux transporter MFP subunit
MKYLFILLAVAFVGCKSGAKSHEGHNHETEEAHVHTEGESLEGHDHEAEEPHSHEAESLEAGHEGHDHAAEAEHNHEAEGHDHAAEESHNHEAEEEHDHAAEAATAVANGVTFTEEQQQKVDFATEEILSEPFGQVIRTTGQIRPSQGDERVVVAKASGIVTFSGGELTEGRSVGAGQALFTIDGSGMADGNLAVRYAEAESEYNRAKTEYERKAELAKDNIVSQSDLLQAETEYRAAEAAYNSLRGNFSAGKQSVSSPIGGFITQLSVRGGQYVAAGQPVLVVSQNRDLLIEAELQPRYFELLGGIVSANFRVLDTGRTYTLEELDGRVVSYGKSTSAANPLIPVVFSVRNNGELLAGRFVEMFIQTQNTTDALTVPREAIVEEMGAYFVYVQISPELFEKRPVEKGVTDGIRTEIRGDIAAGDRVVSRGAILVKLAQGSGALDPHAGHVH